MPRSPRVLLAGVGPGDDPTEAVGLARALRDAGWEVVHLGAVPRPEVVASVAVDEDADAVVVLPSEGVTATGVSGPGAAGVRTAVLDALAARGRPEVTVVDASGAAADVEAALGVPGPR